MLAALSHIDMAPLFYGAILAVGVLNLLHKLRTAQFLVLAVECAVFYIVFSMHRGTLTGGMAAAIAALIVGLVLKRFMRWH